MILRKSEVAPATPWPPRPDDRAVPQDTAMHPLLEPTTAPTFSRQVRGYVTHQVDTYVEQQRRQLALMRARALRAEYELHTLRWQLHTALPPGKGRHLMRGGRMA